MRHPFSQQGRTMQTRKRYQAGKSSFDERSDIGANYGSLLNFVEESNNEDNLFISRHESRLIAVAYVADMNS